MVEETTDLRAQRIAGLKLKRGAAKLPLQKASFAHQIAVLEAGDNVAKVQALRDQYNEVKTELLAEAEAAKEGDEG